MRRFIVQSHLAEDVYMVVNVQLLGKAWLDIKIIYNIKKHQMKFQFSYHLYNFPRLEYLPHNWEHLMQSGAKNSLSIIFHYIVISN